MRPCLHSLVLLLQDQGSLASVCVPCHFCICLWFSLLEFVIFLLLFVFAVDVAKQQDVRIVQQACTAVPALLSQAREHLMLVLSRVDNAGTDKTARNIAVAQVKPAVRHLEPLFSLIKELCDKPGHWWREHWHISDVEVISWKRDKAGEVNPFSSFTPPPNWPVFQFHHWIENGAQNAVDKWVK